MRIAFDHGNMDLPRARVVKTWTSAEVDMNTQIFRPESERSPERMIIEYNIYAWNHRRIRKFFFLIYFPL